MPPEIDMWRRVVMGRATGTSFYVRMGTGDVSVTARSAMLRDGIVAMRAAKQRQTDLRIWNEQARRLAAARRTPTPRPGATLALAVALTICAGCHIPYTCDPAAPDTPDGGVKPNPGANGLPGECEPFHGDCDPGRCPKRRHLTPAPECMCVDDPIETMPPDAGAPI